MYQFSSDFNYTSRFWFKKEYIKDMNWAGITKRAQAIYPVICCHVNALGKAFCGERTIAILSGVSDKYVRQGIRDLEGFPGFKWEYYITTRGKRSKRFMVHLPQVNDRDCFPFHRFVLESAKWRQLIPAAKALYPVMRAYGYFDQEEYAVIEDQEFGDESLFANRKYDFCEADRSVLIEASGIGSRSFNSAIADLEAENMIKTIEYGKWAVYLIPTKYYRRAFINKKVQNSYRHERQ